MYGQFQNSVSSAAKWIVVAFFGVIIMAIFLGVNIKDAKWLNPSIAKAEAERIQVEAAHQQSTYEIQERLAAAQTEAEIQQIQREQKMLDAQYEHDMQLLAQDIANRQRWTDAGINLVIFLGGTTGIAAAMSALIVAIAKAIAILRAIPKRQPIVTSSPTVHQSQLVKPLTEREPYDPWTSPLYRRQKIEVARQAERRRRKEEMATRMKDFIDPARVSKEQYDKLPRVE